MSVAATLATEPVADINTTPLIDVMLVLLIMFIVTVPVATHSVTIDLPGDSPVQVPIEQRNRLTIAADGALLWNGAPIALATLPAVAARVAVAEPTPELHLQPHPDARYERVDEVLAILKRAGVRSMGFVGNENYATF